MLKENQLSTILLLVLVGFVIYKLMQPGTIKNLGTVKESDASTVSEEATQEESEEATQEATQEASEEATQEASEEEGVSKNQVNNFEGTDDTDKGAELSEAFQKPIGNKSSPNKVNFKDKLVKKYDSKDYLPNDTNDKWFDLDWKKASKTGNDSLINVNKYVVGVNTVGQSLKNASWDIRGTVANPKYSVSPWNNSTYEPDYNLKPLC